MRKNLLFILALILILHRFADGQVNDTLIQKKTRPMENIDAEQKGEIYRGVRALLDSCLTWMSLRDPNSVEPYSDSIIAKFRNCFWEEMIESDTGAVKQTLEKKIIRNFFQPRPCNDSSVFPSHYSVNEYIKLIKQWYPDGIDVTYDNIVIDGFPSKDKKDYWIKAIAHLRFNGYGEYECNSISKVADTLLAIVIKLEDWTTSGTKIPTTYKIRWMEYYTPPRYVCYYNNFWSNIDLSVLGGVSSAFFEVADEMTESVSGIGSLKTNPMASYGIEAKFNFFVQDTFSEFNEAKLWDVGFGIGGRYLQQSWEWSADGLEFNFPGLKYSPVNALEFDHYDLNVLGHSLNQTVSYTMVSVPVSIQLKRYFGREKVNSVLFDAGIYVNLLLDQSYDVDAGYLEYTGLNCRFYDPVNDTVYPPFTINELPYYGFDTYEATKSTQGDANEDLIDDLYYSAFLHINFDLRKSNKSAFHWRIGPYMEYTFSNIVKDPAHQMIDISTETQGEIKEFTHSLKTLHPYSVGIRLGISYNYLPNRKKCFLIE